MATAAILRLVSLVGAGLLLWACSTPPPRLYVLSAIPAQAPPPAAATGSSSPPAARASTVRHAGPMLIGIAPITMPDYLDRPEMIERASDNEITVDNQQRWAERLSTNATRVLVENLSSLLGSERIVALPARATTKYEVDLDLSRFDVDTDRSAVMTGRWSIVDAETGTEVRSGAVRLRQVVGNDGFDEIAAAMSRNLEATSREIAAALAQLSHEPQPGARPAERQAMTALRQKPANH